MSRNLKKVLSGVLSAAIIAGAAPMTALAAENKAASPQTAAPVYDDLVTPPDDVTLGGGDLSITVNDLDDSQIITSISDYYSKVREEGDQSSPYDAPGAALPSKVDNSTNQNAKYLPKVRSQGGIGSCSSWSSVYYQFTYTVNKARGVTTTDENTYSPNFAYNLINSSENLRGSTRPENYDVLTYQGAPTIKDVPLASTASPETNYTSLTYLVMAIFLKQGTPRFRLFLLTLLSPSPPTPVWTP